jgi:Family of unknown function (DUF5990)
MIIRIEGNDLPGRFCGPGPDFPDGHHNIHVAVQGRKGQQDLFGLTAGDATTAVWELEGTVGPPPAFDLQGPQVQGPPGKRFIYLTWGVVDEQARFQMFRRAKLWIGDIPARVLQAGRQTGTLVGRLGLTDEGGRPVCAAVRPPRIHWSASTDP